MQVGSALPVGSLMEGGIPVHGSGQSPGPSQKPQSAFGKIYGNFITAKV